MRMDVFVLYFDTVGYWLGNRNMAPGCRKDLASAIPEGSL